MNSTEVSNTQDVIDSRDIIARIRELQDTEDEDEQAELKTLEALQSEAEGYSEDWQYGATLIRDSYMKEYAQQTAEDIGAISPNAQWPLDCIDWEEATEQFKMDYTSVDFDGVDYWVR